MYNKNINKHHFKKVSTNNSSQISEKNWQSFFTEYSVHISCGQFSKGYRYWHVHILPFPLFLSFFLYFSRSLFVCRHACAYARMCVIHIQRNQASRNLLTIPDPGTINGATQSRGAFDSRPLEAYIIWDKTSLEAICLSNVQLWAPFSHNLCSRNAGPTTCCILAEVGLSHRSEPCK